MTSPTSTRQVGAVVRSATWPPTTSTSTNTTQASSSHAPTLPPPAAPNSNTFQDDLSEHPERHFLSPLTAEEYHGWDSDSDLDSEDDGEWNAGITDFSLFTADRKRAMETGQALDGKWMSFVEGQREAFLSTVQEADEKEDVETPSLTPDTSPELRDDLDSFDSSDEAARPTVQLQLPNYLTYELKPSTPSNDNKYAALIGPDDELPLRLSMPWKQLPVRSNRVQRPGLQHARTLSGKRHVWRRPGWDMFTVGEDVEGEEEAEAEEVDFGF